MDESTWSRLVIEKFERAMRCTADQTLELLADVLSDAVRETNLDIEHRDGEVKASTCIVPRHSTIPIPVGLEDAVAAWQKISYNGIIITADFIRNKLLMSGIPGDVATAAGNLLYASIGRLPSDLKGGTENDADELEDLRTRLRAALDVSKTATNDQIILALFEAVDVHEQTKKDLDSLRVDCNKLDKDLLKLKQDYVRMTTERDHLVDKCLVYEAERNSLVSRGLAGLSTFITGKIK